MSSLAQPRTRWQAQEGAPWPLGVTWIEREQAYNFAIYSKHAERLTLVFYGEDELEAPCYTFEFDYLTNKSGRVWHCRIPGHEIRHARYYSYHVDGPSPGGGYAWHAFDPAKLLLDPYAQAVYFPGTFDREAARRPGSNEGHAPLGVLDACRCAFDWGDASPPRHDWDLVIYEMHVRGFTRHPSSALPAEQRGTFAGVVEKIPYLHDLGVTAVELMPVFQFDPGDNNYSGYMPLNFFAPHHAYSMEPGACAQHIEFRKMVKALHESGIEVILDVVYNHTCEGDHRGPTYTFKGIDNCTYYMTTGHPAAPYANYTGTGNTLHTANRAVRQMIVDSLRYWVTEMHVDGFRFDLASVFTRQSNGAINLEDPPILAEIAADPDLARARLIAEPWDAGGAFQLGRQFPGVLWMQWNARYRDCLQQSLRGDAGGVGELMTRLYGSSDLFPDDRAYALRPFQSVNYITSHDGSTLYDLVSYNHKRNWANGHDNTDGPSEFSWNCGWEGNDDVPPAVEQLRKQQVKNFFTLLMLSNGTPMFRMGDEFLQTQGGNNNPYNQDNETSWLDWRRLQHNRDIFRFFKEMIAFRKAHPSIGRSRFWRDDVHWYGPERVLDLSPESHVLAFCVRGASQGDRDLYVMINAGPQAVDFGVHEGNAGDWKRVVDTSLASPDDVVVPGPEPRIAASWYHVAPRSVVVLLGGHADRLP